MYRETIGGSIGGDEVEVEFYRINESAVSGGCNEVYPIVDFAFNLRKQSGWWGDQTLNFSGRLRIDDLRDTLYKKSLCPKLNYPGVYLYRNIKSDGKMYIGRAVKQSILERQQQHLYSASRGGEGGRFESALLCGFSAANWDFYAIPMEESSEEEIAAKERELILKHFSICNCCGYNTQLPGGRS